MKLQKPKHLNTTPAAVINAVQLIPETSLENVQLQQLQLTGLVAKSLSFDEASFIKVVATEARLDRLGLIDVHMTGCNFSAAQLTGASCTRVHVKGSRMTGTDFSRSVCKDVVFEGCKLDLANFRFAKLTRVQFVDCTLSKTDFQVAQLNDVEFTNCQLDEVEFGQCTTKNVDLRSSTLGQLRGWQYLKGVQVDQPQLMTVAPQLAAELGLKVAD